MNPRFFDCVIAKRNNLCFNFFEDYLYLNSISKRLGYRKFIALDGLEGKKNQVVLLISPSASSFPDALKIASYALSFFTLLIIAVVVKAINRYYCHSYKMITPRQPFSSSSSLPKAPSTLNSVPKTAPISKNTPSNPLLPNQPNPPVIPITTPIIIPIPSTVPTPVATPIITSTNTLATADKIDQIVHPPIPQTTHTSPPPLPVLTTQPANDIATYNQYLNFMQNFPSSKEDIFLLQIKYDLLSRKFPTYSSCENKEMWSKINHLKNLYQEKINSLCLTNLESIRSGIDHIIASAKSYEASDQQPVKIFKENLEKSLLALKKEMQQLIEQSDSNPTVPSFFKENLKSLKDMVEKETSEVNTLINFLEQPDPNIAVYNEYLGFIQNPSPDNDVFIVSAKYDELLKKLNVIPSARNGDTRKKIEGLKNIYQEKIGSLSLEKLNLIRSNIDNTVIATKNHKISDQQTMQTLKENTEKLLLALQEEIKQLIERSHSILSLPPFFEDDLKNLRDMIEDEISVINTFGDFFKQPDPDIAIYNEYLDFIQNLSPNNDISALHVKYDKLLREFNATDVSSKSKGMQAKIKDLKNLYREKIESLCRLKIQSLRDCIGNIVTSTKHLKTSDRAKATEEIERISKQLIALKKEKEGYYNPNLVQLPARFFLNDLRAISDIIEKRFVWIDIIKDLFNDQQRITKFAKEFDKVKENISYVINKNIKDQGEEGLGKMQELINLLHIQISSELEFLLESYSTDMSFYPSRSSLPIQAHEKEIYLNLKALNQAFSQDVNGYQRTEGVIKYFEQMNLYFEQEQNAITRRFINLKTYSQRELEEDLAILIEKASLNAQTHRTKLEDLCKFISNPPSPWKTLLTRGMETCSKMDTIKSKCLALKKELELDYMQKAPDVLAALYQEIEKDSKKLESDINKIQPKSEISPANYKLLKKCAAEMDNKIGHFIRIVNEFAKLLPKKSIFKSKEYSITLEKLAKEASAWDKRSPTKFIFFSSELEARFLKLKKKPLEIYEDFTFSDIKIHMDHLQKKVIGLEIPEVGNIDLKQKYKEIYNQCIDLIPKKIADDNQELNLDQSNEKNPSVITAFDRDLENLINAKQDNYLDPSNYFLHIERKKLLTHIALTFESRKKEIDKIKDPAEKGKAFNNYRNDLTMVWMELAISPFHCIDRQINVPLSIYNAHVAPQHALPEKALALDNQIARQLLLFRREIFEKALSNMALSWSPDFHKDFQQHRASTERLVRKTLNDEFGLQYSENLFIGANFESYGEYSQIEAVRQEFYRKYTPQAICERLKTVIMDNHKERENRHLNFDRIYDWFKKQYLNTELNPILTDEGDLKLQAIYIFLQNEGFLK